jgi:hypothetical protein
MKRAVSGFDRALTEHVESFSSGRARLAPISTPMQWRSSHILRQTQEEGLRIGDCALADEQTQNTNLQTVVCNR